MMKENNMSLKVAVLIDAENIAPKYAQLILSEASNFGSVVRRRIYGDWSLTTLSSWKTPIMDYSINPIQQFHNTTGKNSSDSALIIDAMDLLHEERYQCVCIVSSDSDFTRLAARLRESEIYVVGMGEQMTPASFRSACDRFLYLDLLEKEEEKKKSESIAADEKGEQVMALRENDQNGLNLQTVIATINGIIDTESDEDGWAGLATVGYKLNAKISDFDVRNFGCSKLTQFIKGQAVFEVKEEKSQSNPNIKVVYIRKK